MTTRRVAWRRSDEVPADELCTLTLRDGGLSLVGTVLGAEGGLPVRIEYQVMADGIGMTTAVHVRDLRGFVVRTIALARDARGGWTVDGKPAPLLGRCTDVDLGCSPSTNTLPLRRLRLGVGASHTIQAAWVRFPELTVVKAAQTYTRVDDLAYRTVMAEVDDLGSLGLEEPSHDVDGGVVAVKQTGGGNKTHLVGRAVVGQGFEFSGQVGHVFCLRV